MLAACRLFSLKRLLLALCWCYFIALGVWAVTWLLAGDATAWLFAVNSLALFLFVPVPLAAAVAVWLRSRPLAVPLLASVVLWVALWGELFLPSSEAAGGAELTVMTFNVFGFNQQPDGVVRVIRESDADVVGLLELGRQVATAIEQELDEEYPYRSLDPRIGTRGSGLLSRLPFEEQPLAIAGHGWISPPAAVDIQLDGREITFVRFHAASGPRYWRLREEQARILARFAATHPKPLIVAGDLNAASTNDAYRSITQELDDAWSEAGTGFGHTFPGASRAVSPGSSRPQIFGLDVPKWLIRIDYVFHSEQFRAVSAKMAADGASDHRAVIVRLMLTE